MINDVTIFEEYSILDVWQDSEHASVVMWISFEKNSCFHLITERWVPLFQWFALFSVIAVQWRTIDVKGKTSLIWIEIYLNPLSADPTKWSNTPKQFVECFSPFCGVST